MINLFQKSPKTSRRSAQHTNYYQPCFQKVQKLYEKEKPIPVNMPVPASPPNELTHPSPTVGPSPNPHLFRSGTKTFFVIV